MDHRQNPSQNPGNGGSSKRSRPSFEDESCNSNPETSMFVQHDFNRPDGIQTAKRKAKQRVSTNNDDDYDLLKEKEKVAYEHMMSMLAYKMKKEERKLEKQRSFLRVKEMELLLALMACEELSPEGEALKISLMKELTMG